MSEEESGNGKAFGYINRNPATQEAISENKQAWEKFQAKKANEPYQAVVDKQAPVELKQQELAKLEIEYAKKRQELSEQGKGTPLELQREFANKAHEQGLIDDENYLKLVAKADQQAVDHAWNEKMVGSLARPKSKNPAA